MSMLKSKKGLLSLAVLVALAVYPSAKANNTFETKNESQIIAKVDDEDFDDKGFLVDKDGVLLDYKGNACDVVIPSNVKIINEYAFSNHSEINSVILPEGLVKISHYAFSGCTGLDEVKIPDSVEVVERFAFSNCTNMKKIHIGKNVKDIGQMCFWLCSALKKIEVSEDNTVFASYKGVLYNKDFSVLIECPQGFDGKFIAFKKIRKVGDYAFAGCFKLDKIVFNDELEEIGEAAFFGCNSLMKVHLGKNLTSIGACAFASCSFLDSVCIPSTVQNIGASAFYGCKSLRGLTVKSMDVEIGENAFKDCYFDFYLEGLENSTVQAYAIQTKTTFFAVNK